MDRRVPARPSLARAFAQKLSIRPSKEYLRIDLHPYFAFPTSHRVGDTLGTDARSDRGEGSVFVVSSDIRADFMPCGQRFPTKGEVEAFAWSGDM